MKKFIILLPLLGFMKSSAQKSSYDLESLFNNVFKTEGGRLYRAQYPRYLSVDTILVKSRLTIERIKKTYPSLPNIYFDIVRDSSINAYSQYSNGQYFIGITIGALIVFQDAFYRMASSKKVFSDIGDTSKEVSSKRIPSLQAFRLSEYQKNTLHGALVIPNDFNRIVLGKTLFDISIEFLVAHECGHILHGHVLYENSINNNFLLKEVGDERFTGNVPLPILFWQDREIDADMIATSQCLIHANEFINGSSILAGKPRNFYKSWQMFIRLFIFSTGTIYKILTDNARKSLSSLHPPPSIRAYFIQAEVPDILFGKKGIDNIDVPSICLSVWDEVDRAFSEVSNMPLDYSDMKLVLDPAIHQREEDLRSYFNIFYPIIQPFSYVDLSPLYK
jgi:hypothetical protein